MQTCKELDDFGKQQHRTPAQEAEKTEEYRYIKVHMFFVQREIDVRNDTIITSFLWLDEIDVIILGRNTALNEQLKLSFPFLHFAHPNASTKDKQYSRRFLLHSSWISWRNEKNNCSLKFHHTISNTFENGAAAYVQMCLRTQMNHRWSMAKNKQTTNTSDYPLSRCHRLERSTPCTLAVFLSHMGTRKRLKCSAPKCLCLLACMHFWCAPSILCKIAFRINTQWMEIEHTIGSWTWLFALCVGFALPTLCWNAVLGAYCQSSNGSEGSGA